MNQGPDQWDDIQHSAQENESQNSDGQEQSGQPPRVDLNNNRPAPPSPLEISQRKYNLSRSNLLFATVISFINVVALALGSGFYLLFSAFLPLALTSGGVAIVQEGEAGQSLVYIMAGISLLIILPYLLCWIFSKRHYVWMIIALVYFSIDCLFMLLSFDVSLLLDILFHVWVMYYLIVGVKHGARLHKAKKEQEQQQAQQPPQDPPQNNDFDAWNHFEQ